MTSRISQTGWGPDPHTQGRGSSTPAWRALSHLLWGRPSLSLVTADSSWQVRRKPRGSEGTRARPRRRTELFRALPCLSTVWGSSGKPLLCTQPVLLRGEKRADRVGGHGGGGHAFCEASVSLQALDHSRPQQWPALRSQTSAARQRLGFIPIRCSEGRLLPPSCGSLIPILWELKGGLAKPVHVIQA